MQFPHGADAPTCGAFAPRSRRRTAFAVLVGLLGPLLPLPGQALAEGFAARVRALPANAGCVARTKAGGFVWADGGDVWLAASGAPLRSLCHFAPPVSGSFSLALETGVILFAEGTTNGLWLLPERGPAPGAPLATIPFAYDAAALDHQRVVVSARTGGWGAPANDLILLDLASGATAQFASVPGASGPVAVADNGDVYYATGSLQWPPPPAQTTVLRFRRQVVDQALATRTVLGLAQAETVFAGLDSAGDLAFGDGGDLWFTDWWQSAVSCIAGATGSQPTRYSALDYTTAAVGPNSLQFAPGTARGAFAPFQPTNGTLYVHETSWGTASRVRSVSAARAVLSGPATLPMPAGPCVLALDGGAAAGFAVLALAFGNGSGESAVPIQGSAVPLFWAPLLQGAPLAWVAPLDAAGHASFVLQNPGAVPPLPAVAQAAFVDASRSRFGSTAPLPLQFGQ